jgi:hypothetical protein
MKASFTPIALFYIWPRPTKEWNFASAVSFPLAWLNVEAGFTTLTSARVEDDAFNFSASLKF